MKKNFFNFIVKYFIVSFLIIITTYFVLSVSNDFINLLSFAPVIILTASIFFALNDLKNRIVYLMFQVSFFTFLLGETFFALVNQGSVRLHNLMNDSYIHSFFSMALSLICIFIGYYFFQRKSSDYLVKYRKKYSNSNYINKIQFLSAIIFSVSFFAQAAVLIEKGIFVRVTSYSNYYLNYSSRLPFVITAFAAFYYLSFYVFLATLPSKRKASPIIIMSIIISVLSLIFGQRNGFVLDILILIVYLTIRNKELLISETKEKWLSKYQVIIGVCILPLALSALYSIGQIRFGIETTNNSILENVEDFFVSQGGSIHVITYGYEYQDKIPKQKVPYTLGPLQDYLTQNFISNTVFGYQNWQNDPVKKATEASLYGSSLAYLLFPDGYLNGKGMDSSYIAELYHDFGYIGIIIGSIIIGYIIRICDSFRVKKWWSFAMLLFITRGIIYIPRTSALGWIVRVFNVPNIILLLIISISAQIIITQKKGVDKSNI